MQTDNNTLIDELIAITKKCNAWAEEFAVLTYDELLFKHEGEWCILECLEHLNLYGDFYLPEIEMQMMTADRNQSGRPFRSGWLGNYFAELMRVKEGKVKKMKSPKDKNPALSPVKLPITVLNRFQKQQDTLLHLLEKCRNLDLVNTKCSISLSPYIKLRLGDTLRFYVYHIERHVIQANNVSKKLAKATITPYQKWVSHQA